ncbi:hypothetical protein [Streptacidiphilus monticola]|uniref:DUF5753 domain-containing protein n=1 Tax=Streptacidiphilus monticola TaxID=2161674 RepID=A0ABW1GBA5_9ACTN
MEIVIKGGVVRAVASGPNTPASLLALEIATYLPLPSLLEGARILHDQDENLTAIQLPSHAGPVLVVMPPAEDFEFSILHEAETGRRILGAVRPDRRTSNARQIAYCVTEFLRTRALI